MSRLRNHLPTEIVPVAAHDYGDLIIAVMRIMHGYAASGVPAAAALRRVPQETSEFILRNFRQEEVSEDANTFRMAEFFRIDKIGLQRRSAHIW